MASTPSRPYARSWVNVLTSWLERLPGPTWLAYVGAVVIGILLSVVCQCAVGIVGIAYYGALPFAILGLIHRLDRAAGQALRSVRPLLQMDETGVAGMHYQLTVVPARPAALLALAAIVVTQLGYVMDPVGSGIVGLSTEQLLLRDAWESFVTALFLVLVYHTIRQLRLIGRVHEGIKRIDVFAQGPLYTLSRVTSMTALGFVLLLVPSVFLIPPNADVPYIVITAAWYGAAVLVSTAAFVLPLWGIHDRLVDEKRRLQGEIGRRLTTTVEAIHAAVDAQDGEAIEARNRALSTLIAERDLVNRIPTWPWSTGALTGFVSAVFLPIGLWIVTRALERLV